MKRALIAVDVQRDFIDGALGGAHRDAVITPLAALAYKVDLTIATRDWHPPDHCSFEAQGGPWPRHCVRGSVGAQLARRIAQAADYVVNKGTDPAREAYSGFTGELIRVLYAHATVTSSLIIGGLVTEYCVLETVLDARKFGWDVTVPLDAIAGIDEASSRIALDRMRAAGVRVVETID